MTEKSTLTHTMVHRQASADRLECFGNDFIIDGKSLKALLDQSDLDPNNDLLGCFIAGANTSWQELKHKQLLGFGEPDTPSGRVILYMNPDYASIINGAYTVQVNTQDDIVTWQNFAYEDGSTKSIPIKELAPIHFDIDSYQEAIDKLLE